VEPQHALVERGSKERAELHTLAPRIGDEVLVPDLVVELGSQSGTVFAAETHEPLPPGADGRDGIFAEGRKTCNRAAALNHLPPVQHGRGDITAVTDQMDDLRAGKESVQCPEAPDLVRGLLSDERLAVRAAVKVEHTADEDRVGEVTVRLHEAPQILAADAQILERRVPQQAVDQGGGHFPG
jgi:hypothetical protein